jgi:flagellar biosynthesis protein FliQ
MSRYHRWLGVTAAVVLPVLVVALVLTLSVGVLLAVVVDGSVVARFAAEWWRKRRLIGH